jgi:hypothetical protein
LKLCNDGRLNRRPYGGIISRDHREDATFLFGSGAVRASNTGGSACCMAKLYLM